MQTSPRCVGIILDGNRRWAKERGLPTAEGHRQGAKSTDVIALAARDLGIEHLALYAFSTENWKRSGEEVSYLMELFEEAIRDHFSRLTEEGIRVRFVGQLERFSDTLRTLMREVEAKNPAELKMTLWVCLSYGGQAEIVEAARALATAGEEITEESLAQHLWTAQMPDPDLIIRTGGEHRLSNFLLWKSAYSELFFPGALWPAFTKVDLENILEEYATRERRLGK